MRVQPQHSRTEPKRRNIGAVLSVVCALAIGFSPLKVFAGQHGSGQQHPAPPHISQPHPGPPVRQQAQPQSVPQGQMRPQPQMNSQPQYGGQFGGQQFTNRAGQPQHLSDWLSHRQNLTPQQRENALRQEPGFNRLPQDQQQRLINRMHTLNEATPEQRQRMLQRNEIFEHLNPEQKAGVRGASQAFHQMPIDRQTEMRRAFKALRGVQPEQRQSILDSARFQQQFSPQERTVLGNLLAVEPYEPRAAGP